MGWQTQRNFFFVWVIMLLAIAIVLTLTLSGCSGQKVGQESSVPVVGAATHIQGSSQGCTDTDGGKELAAKGIAASGEMSYADKCAGGFLIEYYCEDGKITSQNFRCEKGCEKGACI